MLCTFRLIFGAGAMGWHIRRHFFLSFCYFFGLLPWHMEVPRLEVQSEL